MRSRMTPERPPTELADLWIYVVAPVAGAAAGAFAYQLVRGEST